jgi:hypothetical protein
MRAKVFEYLTYSFPVVRTTTEAHVLAALERRFELTPRFAKFYLDQWFGQVGG